MNKIWKYCTQVTLVFVIIAQFSIASASVEAAESFIRKISGKAFNILETETSDHAIIHRLEHLFENSVEISWIAKFILGRYYKTLDDSQIKIFQKTYKNYLLYKYTPKFKTVVGYDFEIVNTKPLGKGYYLINARVFDPEKANPILVEYRVKEFSSGRMFIRDISVEGVSLILTHRSDFTNFLHDNTFNDLLQKLKTKDL